MQQTQASNKWNADSTYVLRMYIKCHGYHRIWCHRWKNSLLLPCKSPMRLALAWFLFADEWIWCGQMDLLHTWCRRCPKSTMHWSLWTHWTTRYPVHSISVDSGDLQHLTTTSTLPQVLIKVQTRWFCVHLHILCNDAIPTWDKKSTGSSLLHVVSFAIDVPGLDTHKHSGKYDK